METGLFARAFIRFVCNFAIPLAEIRRWRYNKGTSKKFQTQQNEKPRIVP